MVKKIFGAVVALAVTILLSTSVLAQDFPSSTVSPSGKPWTTMNPNGFTGGYAEACDLLSLNAEQCTKYQGMHTAGTCRMMQVPNGVVLDALTFTRGDKHQVDRRVKVELVNPPTRDTEVCDLGDGTIVMRFLGCNNHAVVNNTVVVTIPEGIPEPMLTTRPRSNPFPVPTASCPIQSTHRWLNVSMYAPEAAEHNCSQQYMLPADGLLEEDDPRAREFLKSDMAFSTQCGAVIRQSGIALGIKEHKVEAFLQRLDGSEEVFFEGVLKGDRLTANSGWEGMVSPDKYALMIPEKYKEGIIVFGFPEHGIRTPTASGFGDSVSKFEYPSAGPTGCHVNQYIGIELP